MIIEAIILFCSGVFFGAALYISLVQHPATLAVGLPFGARFFAPMYKRAAPMQAQHWADAISKIILEDKKQWFWLHRRFKFLSRYLRVGYMLLLRDHMLIFKGASRDVYKIDEEWCIKISCKKDNAVNSRELANYVFLSKSPIHDYLSRVKPKLIDTNLGKGLCCKLVNDYNGERSKNLIELQKEKELIKSLKEQFYSFFDLCDKSKLFFYDFNGCNFLIQQYEQGKYCVKFIDVKNFNNSKTFFNLEKWLPLFAKNKFKRRKKRFFLTYLS